MQPCGTSWCGTWNAAGSRRSRRAAARKGYGWCGMTLSTSAVAVCSAQHYDSVGDSAIWPNTDAKRTELCIFADTVVTYVLRYGYGLGGPLCYVRLRLPI